MAVTLVQSASANYASSPTATFSSAPTEGNLLVAYTAHRSGAQDASLTGWTKIIERDVATADSTYRKGEAIFAKIAGASESQNVSPSWSSGASHAVIAMEFNIDSGSWDDLGSVASASGDDGSDGLDEDASPTGTTSSTANQLGVVFGEAKLGSSSTSISFSMSGYTFVANTSVSAFAVSVGGLWQEFSTTAARGGTLTIAPDGTDCSFCAAIAVFGYAAAGGDTNISAGTKTYALAENAAIVSHDISISSGTKSYTLTENQATVSLNVDISSGVKSYTLTPSASTITHDIGVNAAVKSYTLTTYQASFSEDIAISVGAKAYTLTENQATVSLDIGVSSGVKAYTLTTHKADLGTVNEVSVGVKSYTLTTNQATLTRNINVNSNVVPFTLTANQASISTGKASAPTGGASPRKRHRQFVNLNGNLVEVGSYKEAVSLINNFNKGKKKPNNLKKRRITFANGPYVSVYDSEAMPLKEIKKNLNIFHDDEDMLLLMLIVA